MNLTLLGMVIEVNPVQPENALPPILFKFAPDKSSTESFPAVELPLTSRPAISRMYSISVPFKFPVTVRLVIWYFVAEAINDGRVPAVATLIVTGGTSCAYEQIQSNEKNAAKKYLIDFMSTGLCVI